MLCTCSKPASPDRHQRAASVRHISAHRISRAEIGAVSRAHTRYQFNYYCEKYISFNTKRDYTALRRNILSVRVQRSASCTVRAFNASMRAVVVTEPGGPAVLRIGEVPAPELKPGHVLIDVKCTALNSADQLQRRGLYPPPPGASETLGLEAAGVVSAVAAGVANVQVGDRVMALLSGGGSAEVASCPALHVMKIPDELSFEEAATIPEVWLTAYLGLIRLANLTAGETVLVHAAGSGVGLAAIQICRHVGASVIATAGSQAKLEKAKELGAEAVINYKEEDFVRRTLAATEGKGVDVVLDLVGASHFPGNLEALGMHGRLLLTGTPGGATAEINIRTVMNKRLQIIGSTLRSRSDEFKAQLVSDFAKFALPSFAAGKLKANVWKVLPFEDIVAAHQLLEEQRNIGKIVVKIAD